MTLKWRMTTSCQWADVHLDEQEVDIIPGQQEQDQVTKLNLHKIINGTHEKISCSPTLRTFKRLFNRPR